MNVSSNKWLNAIIFFVVVFIACLLALLLVSFKRNKNGVLKATLDISNATTGGNQTAQQMEAAKAQGGN